jgi:hypothetical protein
MASQPVSRAKPFTDGLRRRWTAISATLAGDILATALAIGGICVLFLAGTLAILALMRAAEIVLRLMR